MNESLEETIAQLENAVRAAMNPETSHDVRMRAYQTCEEFKESSGLCAQCGVIMACKNRDPITRHFGLQLIEHCVKFRWNKIPIEQKQFLKENTLKMMSEGTMDLLQEQIYIKDALSRIVVEMIKREWPQQWPTMLSELDAIYNIGATQTELVLLIFLRLAEDILIFQSAPCQRRRDIMQGLTNVMSQLFPCFVNTLVSNVTAYKQATVSGISEDNRMTILVSSRLASSVLETITAFIDWINVSHIIDQDGRLLRILCTILDDTNLRLLAAECLLAITNRKGKLEDRQPLLILFSADAMTIILNAAVVAATAELDEHNYIFLKRLCQVLTALGSQLCTLWGNVKDVGQPATFRQFLEALLAFADHPSLVLCGLTIPMWSSLLKHEHISKDSILLSFVGQLVSSAVNTLVKTGFPSQNNSPRCRYSRLDFDNDEDFFTFFTRLRADCAEMLRCAASICPEMMFRFIASRINDQIKKPVVLGEGCDHGHCNLSSPSFLEWDALTIFLESVMSRLLTPEKDSPLYNEGLLLFNNVLSYETVDPLIRSAVLSVVSALFPFIVHSSSILPFVLEKIFTTAVFNVDGQTKATRSRAVKNVRRHACSVLVKICKLYPNLLLPSFSELYQHVQLLSNDPDGLSQMEKCTLMEALILINNQNKDYKKQLSFLSEIIAPVKAIWLSPEVKEALSSADCFIKFVGLHQSPVEPSANDVCGINRSQLAYCVISILAMLKRSQCPETAEESAAGGFLSVSESGVSYTCNPATQVLMGLVDNMLRLCRTVNELYLAENLTKRHPGFFKAYDLLDMEKMVFLGIQPPLIDNTNSSTNKQPLDRMQSFIAVLHENCFHVLGNVGRTFGYDFYRLPNLATSVLNSYCMFIEALPEYRLRIFVRSFLKLYVFWCPKEFYPTAVLPILAKIARHFHERLCSRWEIINQKCAESSNEEENSESQEVLEEMIVRHLTREYLEFLGVIFREKNKSTLETNDDMVTDDGEAKKLTREEKIGELGILVLQDSTIFPTLVHTLFMTLSWNDTTACSKAINWCVPVLKQLMVPPVKLSADDATYLLGSVLMGLRMHGQHEALQSYLILTALQIYELLVPEFSKVKEVMLQISSCSAKDLQKFTDLITVTTVGQQPRIGDKKKKEMFKSLVQDAIGQNIGQQFKKEVIIKNLAPFQSHRRKAPPLVELETHEIGLCALFGNDADDLN